MTLKAQFPFQNPVLDRDLRVKDLIGRLSLDEKISLMMNQSPAIARLGIPAYNWWSEGLHGVARSGLATVFPQAIGLAATFNPVLAQQESRVISLEARAMFNASNKLGVHFRYGGLSFWTPNINIFRDPRWGRGQETYGEDPYLTAKMGASFVKGLQGDDPNHLIVAACAKHFAVHSGPEKLRHSFDAVVSAKDLRETYLPAFKELVGAGVEAVMCAYNRTNHEPCCGSNLLLDSILRKEWGFQGHVVTDCGAIGDFYMGHQVVPGQAEAVALSVKHDVDLNCGDEYTALKEALNRGLLSEKEIDWALSRVLNTRFRLGLLDPLGYNPLDTLSSKWINSDGNRKLARLCAQQSMVLLKNNGVLPLKNNLPRYYLTGPSAANLDVLLGNYYGVNSRMVSILEGLSSAIDPGSQLQYKPGFLLDQENPNPNDWTTGDAKECDVTFVAMGISGLLEGEEGESIASNHAGDRLDYNLPPNQINFLKKLREGNSHKIVAVITGGSPMNLSKVQELADAVILVWYPGEEGGNALSDLVFGKVSPSGHLPVTFPTSLDQLPAYENYSMQGRTYRYMNGDPLYPFGFGLSYTHFSFGPVTLSKSRITGRDSSLCEVEVTNSGKMEADELVQLYVTPPQTGNQPHFSLKGFKRIHLLPGKSEKVAFTLLPETLKSIGKDGKSSLVKGTYSIYLGGCLPIQRSIDLGSDPFQVAHLVVR